MGWLSRATGCVFLLTVPAQASAGTRIAYPTPSQMYALLGSDVEVTFGSVLPNAPIPDPAPSTDGSNAMPVLMPSRYGFPSTEGGFAPSVRDYGMSPLDAAAPLPELDARIDGFWNIRQNIFPEQQRTRLHSPTDTMLTLSIGGSQAPNASLNIDGGVAGALWTIAQRQQAK
jgi:hypothetical protein